MTTGIQLIVGLGNPGSEYQDTRHNAGFWFISQLAQSHTISLRLESKFFGLHGAFSIMDHHCHLLEPMTFMNLSGKAVKAIAHFYKIEPKHILVVHDEIDLASGVVRLKSGGGHGGHNGLRDIIAQIGPDFHRLRIGVDHPGDRNEVINYVLASPKKADRELIQTAMDDAEKILPLLLHGELQKAMQALHTNPIK